MLLQGIGARSIYGYFGHTTKMGVVIGGVDGYGGAPSDPCRDALVLGGPGDSFPLHCQLSNLHKHFMKAHGSPPPPFFYVPSAFFFQTVEVFLRKGGSALGFLVFFVETHAKARPSQSTEYKRVALLDRAPLVATRSVNKGVCSTSRREYAESPRLSKCCTVFCVAVSLMVFP